MTTFQSVRYATPKDLSPLVLKSFMDTVLAFANRENSADYSHIELYQLENLLYGRVS